MLSGCRSTVVGRDLSGRRWDRNALLRSARKPPGVDKAKESARVSPEALALWRSGSGVLKQEDLPPAPAHSYQMRSHIFADEFREAELAHLQSHAEAGTWQEVDKGQATTKVLDFQSPVGGPG